MLTATYEVVPDAEAAYAFCSGYFTVSPSRDAKGICQKKNGEVISAVLYEQFNGQNVFMHVAAIPGRKWMTRHYLHEAFKFPFLTLGVRRITGWVEKSNVNAHRLNIHLGLQPEALLERAAEDGGDVVIYRMFREECRYA